MTVVGPVVGAGRGTFVVVPGLVVVLVVVVLAVLVLFAELTMYEPADSVKSDEKADHSTGSFGSGNSRPSSFFAAISL